ncbi:SRPBCC family protein [Rossellomorea sp. BNER]|uniref:SRPBCC family protein n=1 Tax=Rossellomorea sp. BNER TaxID=2962031 RepID=UPI003AF24C44|nr:SRPBCC family protein [Rossellomorea sp. BNER]
MAELQDSVVIQKPVNVVFQYASDLKNSPKIMENVVAVEKLTIGETKVGTQYKETREIRGKKAEAVIKFIEFTPNQSYAVESEHNGLRVVYTYQFKENGENTFVDFKGDIEVNGLWMKLMKPMIVKILKKEDGDHLRNLKNVMERE